jgi:hypothetical protein
MLMSKIVSIDLTINGQIRPFCVEITEDDIKLVKNPPIINDFVFSDINVDDDYKIILKRNNVVDYFDNSTHYIVIYDDFVEFINKTDMLSEILEIPVQYAELCDKYLIIENDNTVIIDTDTKQILVKFDEIYDNFTIIDDEFVCTFEEENDNFFTRYFRPHYNYVKTINLFTQESTELYVGNTNIDFYGHGVVSLNDVFVDKYQFISDIKKGIIDETEGEIDYELPKFNNFIIENGLLYILTRQ